MWKHAVISGINGMGIFEFQKDLIVWKHAVISGINSMGILFQKNLIVWKHSIPAELYIIHNVSEGLNSVETCMRTPVRGSKRNVSEGLNSVETKSSGLDVDIRHIIVSEGLNSVET